MVNFQIQPNDICFPQLFTKQHIRIERREPISMIVHRGTFKARTNDINVLESRANFNNILGMLRRSLIQTTIGRCIWSYSNSKRIRHSRNKGTSCSFLLVSFQLNTRMHLAIISIALTSYIRSLCNMSMYFFCSSKTSSRLFTEADDTGWI